MNIRYFGWWPALWFAAVLPLHGVVTPYAHYKMGDDGTATSGGSHLPHDSSGHERHMAGTALGIPTIHATGGPRDDAYYSFSGQGQYYFGTNPNISWNPPKDNVGVEVWVRTDDLSQVGKNIFGTGDNLKGLNIGYDAGDGRGWFGAISSVAYAGVTGTGAALAGEWVHLAVVRSQGVTTFYFNGDPLGSIAGEPKDVSGTGSLHMAVASGGILQFRGDLADARIFTFEPGAFDPAADLSYIPQVRELVHEEIVETVPGRTYLARFEITPAAGEAEVPRMRLEATGDSMKKILPLDTELPAGLAAVPYTVKFEADSATTRLSFSTSSGVTALPEQIARLEVSEPILSVPSETPGVSQQAQIDRRYGLFLHFGINTFHNEEWTDGSKPVSSYQPTAVDVEQWIQTAYEAGMRYVLLISKHHDGFCVWDTPWTDYGVNSADNKTDILAVAAAACAKYGIKMGIYYSLWDRHEPTYHNDATYDQYMLRHLAEIMGNYGPVCELWLDGAWDKPNHRWPSVEIYDLVRRLQPDCQVTTNWTIGVPGNPDYHPVLPSAQQNGYPIRYFPSDFRLGDPYSPAFPDPKLFTHEGNTYYMPFEATVTLSSQNKWFYNTGDSVNKSVKDLALLYYKSTAQDNLLVLNAPPDRNGRVREIERTTLFQLRDQLGLAAGVPLPKNVTGTATAIASAVWEDDVPSFGPQHMLDGDPDTRWASGPDSLTSATVTIDFDSERTFNRIMIDEYEHPQLGGRIRSFRLQSWRDGEWSTFHTGTTCGRVSLHNVPTQQTSRVRLLIDSMEGPAAIWEFQIHQADHAFSAWRDEHFPNAHSDPSFAWDGDPDGDGRNNLMEFALNDDPKNAAASGRVGVQTIEREGKHVLAFTIPVRNGAVFTGAGPLRAAVDGVIYRVFGSDDLTSFDAQIEELHPAASDGLPELSPGWSYHSFIHREQGNPNGFFRVGVSRE